MTNEIRLDCGAVIRWRPVPPYAIAQAWSSLRDPPPPTQEIESAAGHTEKVRVDEDSPEFDRYVQQLGEVRQLRAQRMQDLTLDYGIVDWLPPPPDGVLGVIVKALRTLGIKRWRDEPPQGWKIPERLERYGVGEYIDRRLTYIHVELLQTRADLQRVYAHIGPRGAAGALENEEVEAAEASFREAVGGRAAPGPAEATDPGDGFNSRGDSRREEVGP